MSATTNSASGLSSVTGLKTQIRKPSLSACGDETIPPVIAKPWTHIFRRSTLGAGVYRLHETDPLDAESLEQGLIAAGACTVERASLYEPMVRAAALPGGATFRMVDRYGLQPLPAGTWVIGPRALRQVLRLLKLGQPRRRLSGETDEIPSVDDLEAEWSRYVATPIEDRVGATLPWLRLTGAQNLEQVRSASPVRFPVTATAADAASFDPSVRDGWFYMGVVQAKCREGLLRVSPDGVQQRSG